MAEIKKKYNLCLNMIVKNEGEIIEDTLKNLTDHLPIDYWVISDTGSTDDTIEKINKFFKEKNIDGELFQDEWQDFAYNRTIALEHAYNKSEYLFIFDADDRIFGNINLPNILNKDSYNLGFGNEKNIQYVRPLIINNKKKWIFKGVLHEYLECLETCNNETEKIIGDYYIHHNTVKGDRSKIDVTEKYLKDALILEKAYSESLEKKDTIYERYAFYCANSYKDCQKYEKAIKWYKIVLTHNNWKQEKYISCLRIFECYKCLNNPESGFFYLIEAYKYDNTRLECIYELVSYYSLNDMKKVAYNMYSLYKETYEKSDIPTYGKLFIDSSKAFFYLPYQMIIVSYYENQIETGINMYKIIFKNKYKEFNEQYIKYILFNLQFYIDKVDKIDNEFFILYKEYLEFLLENNYPLYKHIDLLNKYKKYLVPIEEDSTIYKLSSEYYYDTADIEKITEKQNNNEVIKSKEIVIAILAKDKSQCLDYYLECIYNQNYDKKLIHLYIKTNDNNDNTAEILENFINTHKDEYASIYFDKSDILEELKKYSNHDWNKTRFKILGKIRQDSIDYAKNKNAHYFVVDCDNFIIPDTLEKMCNMSELGVISPILRKCEKLTLVNSEFSHVKNDIYSNYHESTDSNGYYLDSSRYYDILNNKTIGLHKVDVVHCTYFIHNKFLNNIQYNDGTNRHEYVIFSENLRKNKINQYIDNSIFYGFLTFAEQKKQFDVELNYWKDKMGNIKDIKGIEDKIEKNNDIYLSLTTRPERLISKYFKKVYNSLKNQLTPFKKLIINLSVKEFTYNIPDYLYNDENVILNETDICGPCTKLLGSIDIIPDNTIVIVLDDDIIMQNNFIKSLYESYLINPNKVTSHFTKIQNNFVELAGFGGYIFNINILRDIKKFYTTMPECCIKIDDTWISWCIKQLDIDIINTIEKDPWNKVLDISNTNSHPVWYELCKDTDRQKLINEMLQILK